MKLNSKFNPTQYSFQTPIVTSVSRLTECGLPGNPVENITTSSTNNNEQIIKFIYMETVDQYNQNYQNFSPKTDYFFLSKIFIC